MKCHLIQDLLPLYYERLISEETASEIEEHLRTCEQCAHVYENMNEKDEIPELPERNVRPLKKIKRQTRQKIILSFLAGLLCFLAFYHAIAWSATQNIRLTSSDHVKVESFVYPELDDSVTVHFHMTAAQWHHLVGWHTFYDTDARPVRVIDGEEYQIKKYQEFADASPEYEMSVYQIPNLPFTTNYMSAEFFPNDTDMWYRVTPDMETAELIFHFSDGDVVYDAVQIAKEHGYFQ